VEAPTASALEWKRNTERPLLAVIPGVFHRDSISDAIYVGVCAKALFLLEKAGEDSLRRVPFDEYFVNELLKKAGCEMREELVSSKADDVSEYIAALNQFLICVGFDRGHIPISDRTDCIDGFLVLEETPTQQNDEDGWFPGGILGQS
jgi:hypothetical protein